MLVIEDIHWADRSSRDLIAFLSRNLKSAPVLMVMTYRSDELHRTHPLRPVLAELGRVDGVVRVDLPRFTQNEVAAQMAGILGVTPEFAKVDRVFDRSGGIPLFVEALLDCGDDCSFPDSLHDLIIGSVERLPEETQRVLRIAAAGGVRVGHDLLAAVSGLSDVDLENALRPAIAANVLQVADGGAYAFRQPRRRARTGRARGSGGSSRGGRPGRRTAGGRARRGRAGSCRCPPRPPPARPPAGGSPRR